MKTDGRKTPERRAQQGAIARAAWTLERRKAHSKRQAPPECHAAIDAMTETEFREFVAMRADRLTAKEAVSSFKNLRRLA